jgi:hypothetical protein
MAARQVKRKKSCVVFRRETRHYYNIYRKEFLILLLQRNIELANHFDGHNKNKHKLETQARSIQEEI